MLTGPSPTHGPRAVSVTAPGRTRDAHVTPNRSTPAQAGRDAESRAWLQRLRAEGPERDQALRDLRELLLKAARFEVNRRGSALPHLRGGDGEDLAQHSADDALLAILAKLDDFRGESRFTTWAYKFALLEAAVKLRRRAWQGREIPLEAATLGHDRRPALDARPGRRDRRADARHSAMPSTRSSRRTSARSSSP